MTTTATTPMTEKEISSALSRTWEVIGLDVGEENGCGGDVLDFVVSTDGDYAGDWSNARYEITDRAIITAAVARFNRAYGMTE